MNERTRRRVRVGARRYTSIVYALVDGRSTARKPSRAEHSETATTTPTLNPRDFPNPETDCDSRVASRPSSTPPRDRVEGASRPLVSLSWRGRRTGVSVCSASRRTVTARSLRTGSPRVSFFLRGLRPCSCSNAASGAARRGWRKRYERSRLGSRGVPAAAATLATAHYHLGVILADAALAADERGGAGSRSAAGTKAGGLGANPGVSPLAAAAVAPPRTRARRVPRGGRTADHVRLRVTGASRGRRRARRRARGGAPPAASATLEVLRTCSPPRRRSSATTAIPGGGKKLTRRGPRREETSSPRCWTRGGARAIVQGWQTTRRAPRTLLDGVAFPRGKKNEACENGGDVDEINGARARPGARDAMGSPPRRERTRTRRGWRSRGNSRTRRRGARVARRAVRGEKTRGKTGRGDAVSAGWAPYPVG